MRYIILFAPNDETICIVHQDEDDGDGWTRSSIRIFESLADAMRFTGENEFFAKLPYQIVELDLKCASTADI